jgi:hypothetical protein
MADLQYLSVPLSIPLIPLCNVCPFRCVRPAVPLVPMSDRHHI